MWIWLVLFYGFLKGCREICKKKALSVCSSIEVLLVYTVVAFLLVCPDFKNAMGLEPRFYLWIFLKSFVIFIAWICSFHAIKKLPLSFYGVLDLSRVLFATLLGVTVLGEVMSTFNIIGFVIVCTGLILLKFKPKKLYKDAEENAISPGLVVIALISCMLNAFSGLLDKILMKDINSSQLQFWYMLFLCILYIIYALIRRSEVNLRRALTNKWIWLLAIMFVIADRALFIANSMKESQITIMTLLKQIECIVTIIAGRFIFKEKNIGHKIVCAIVIISGIALSVM